MKYKNYKNEILESNFGIIVEGENAGKPSYITMQDIKEVEIDGKWIANEGYSHEKTIENENKIIESKRKSRYEQESDPMFFQFQRGSITKQEWLDAIEVVKKELPYVS